MAMPIVHIDKPSKGQNLDLTMVIPIKDEADNIGPLAREIESTMAAANLRWECLWIDDGSTDASRHEILKLVEANKSHRLLVFEKNAGQSAALWAGFQHSRGRYIATMDGDGQNDPADLPRMTKTLVSDDADMVNGYREHRHDSWLRRVASKIANGFRNLTTGKTVRDAGCSTRVFRRECVQRLPLFAGMHRFLPTLVELHGFKMVEVPVNHRPRRHGKTKYTINNRLWVGLFDCFGVFWLRRRRVSYKIVNLTQDTSLKPPFQG